MKIYHSSTVWVKKTIQQDELRSDSRKTSIGTDEQTVETPGGNRDWEDPNADDLLFFKSNPN